MVGTEMDEFPERDAATATGTPDATSDGRGEPSLADLLRRGTGRDWETVEAAAVDPVRFAVIGLGWFTRGRALPALAASDRCETGVVVSGSPEKAARVADEHDARPLSYDEFLDGAAVDAYDAVYVVTPNALHLEYCRAAAEFGKAVVCEKPVERDADRAAELVAACADVPLYVGYRMHTEPAARRARELIRAGYVGEPQAVQASMTQRLLDRIDDDPDQWRLDGWLAGGGALFDLGLYPLNTARFLLDADPVAAVGRTKSTHDAFDEVDETASFTLQFPDGVDAHCFVSHNARHASEIAVVGTEGRVALRPAFFQDDDRVLHVSVGDTRTSVRFDRVDQMREEFDYVADRLRSGEPMYADGEHGLFDVRAMEAIYESEETDGWVPIDAP
jgi:xylose dehydrogenase (NAD/NADP)